jgi:hypothetical protein
VGLGSNVGECRLNVISEDLIVFSANTGENFGVLSEVKEGVLLRLVGYEIVEDTTRSRALTPRT